jgi:hypothetical protein
MVARWVVGPVEAELGERWSDKNPNLGQSNRQ